jgi:acyl-CoA synthetase (AMP-forming)/AMP-acid ligase II
MDERRTTAGLSLIAGYRAHAVHRPQKLAVTDERGAYTFGELWDSAERYAFRLRRRGIGAGDPVGIAMEGSAAYLAAVVGVMLAGAAAAPLNTALTPVELERYLDILGPAAIVADPYGSKCLSGAPEIIEIDSDSSAVRLDDRLGTDRKDGRCTLGLHRQS